MQPSAALLASFGFFLVLFLAIGGVAARRSTGSERDYLLGGRSFGRWTVGLSAGATGNTGFMLLGAVGSGYSQGFGAMAIVLGFLIGELVFWTFLAERVARATEASQAETVPELVTHRLSGHAAARVRSVTSVLIFVFVGAYLVAQLSGSAKILDVLFGLSQTVGVLLALGAILAYCTTGGLRASIWTDVAQAIIMVFMAVGVTSAALFELGGFAALGSGLAAVDPALASPTGGAPLSFLATTLGFAAIGVGFGLSQPHVTIRLMAGKNVDEVKSARWIYLGFVYLTLSLMVVFGICSRLLLEGLADPEQALPAFTSTRFDPWVVGLILAGMFSTIASSADSQILACSSAIARDFSPAFDRTMTARLGIRYQQAATFLTGIAAALATIYVSSTVFDIVLFSLSVLAASVGAGMFVSVLGRPTSSLAMSLAMVTGVGVALVWRQLGLHEGLSDAVPGFLAAVATHELVGRLRAGGTRLPVA